MQLLTPRRMVPVAVAAAVALLLAGCGDSSDDKSEDANGAATGDVSLDENGCGEFADGEVSQSVRVTGAFGKVQKATFATPLTAESLQRTVVTEGGGAVTKVGQQVEVKITMFRGSNAKAVGTDDLVLAVGNSAEWGALVAGIDCVPVGSRTVATVSAEEFYGEGSPTPQGIKPSDSLVIVTDVLRPFPAAWTKRIPEVAGTKAKPKLVIPKGAPADQLLLKVLDKGDGEVVQAGDNATVDYLGVSWNTKKEFDSSYGGQPATFNTDQVVQGFGAAIVGQTVGSKVIVTIPPKYAYGEKSESGHQLAGQTLVFLIEIRGTDR